MLLDFCCGCARPVIKSDKVSCDGYEVTNLVSPERQLKQRGFLAESFIKPPVSVTVQFPCNIEIFRIVVDPVIGRQKSCHVEVYTASKKLADPLPDGDPTGREVNSDGLLFVCVGKSMMSDPQVTCFQNGAFQARFPWTIDNVPSADHYPVRRELRHHKRHALFYSSHVTIRVTRAGNGSTVAIRRLEIWGKPSAAVPQHIKNKLFEDFKSSLYPERPITTSSSRATSRTSPATDIDTLKLIENGVEIPEDFIDAITFDIMTVPMLLPCGKNIDQSTLEKYVNTEASWGRPPSDPFTGVPFQPGKQAVPNNALKMRVDQFLLFNSQQLKHVPRILGKQTHSNDFQQMKSSRLTDNQLTGMIIPEQTQTSAKCQTTRELLQNTQPSPACYLLEKGPLDSVASVRNVNKRKRSISEITDSATGLESCHTHSLGKPLLVVKKARSATVNSQEANSLDICASLGSNDLNSQQKSRGVTNHRDKLNTSLDSALLSTLSNLPSFTSFSKASPSDPETKMLCGGGQAPDTVTKTPASGSEAVCSGCGCEVAAGTVVKYRMPCRHVICRSCLSNRLDKACSLCGLPFKSENLVRVFQ